MRYKPRSSMPVTLALLMALAACVSAFSPCVHGTVRIRGVITDRGGVPVTKAKLHYFVMEWNDACNSGHSESVTAMTDSTGRYELVGPAGGGYLVVEDSELISGGFSPNGVMMGALQRRAFVLPDTVHTGDIQADFQFERWRVKGQVVRPDGTPMRSGTVVYYPRPPKGSAMCGTGLPEVEVKEGHFELEVDHRGPYIFWATPAYPDSSVKPVWPVIPIAGDTTITIVLAPRR